MQIFAAHADPVKAAEYVKFGKHVTKMPLETAQILCTVWHECGGVPADAPDGFYKPTHKHHPCVKWACASAANYRWLVLHFEALLVNFYVQSQRIASRENAARKPGSRKRERQPKHHATTKFLSFFLNRIPSAMPAAAPTPHPVAIGGPELERVAVRLPDGGLDVHATYRRYADPAEAAARIARRRS